MKKAFIISFILYTTLSSNLNAQDIVVNAKVVDAETREALPNATISSNADKNFIANTDGEFCIEIPPTDELTVLYVGYKPLRIKAGNVESTIKLTPYTIELSEVKVLPLKSIFFA